MLRCNEPAAVDDDYPHLYTLHLFRDAGQARRAGERTLIPIFHHSSTLTYARGMVFVFLLVGPGRVKRASKSDVWFLF
jgi:hypothetical protein